MKNNLYMDMVKYRENLKLFHFVSTKFAEHKASDEILSEYDNKFDQFWEQYQGQYGKLKINNMNINIHNLSHNDMILETNKLLNTLKSIDVDFDLANLRDEIISLLYKFIYLLSFN